MNKIVKNSLLVGCGSVGGFLIGVVMIGKMLFDSDIIRTAIAKEIGKMLFDSDIIRTANAKEIVKDQKKVGYKSYSEHSGVIRKNFDWSNSVKPVFETREEANKVHSALLLVANDYSTVSVADLYDLSSINSSYLDNLYGWTSDMLKTDSKVSECEVNGWTIDLPHPKYIPSKI